MEMKQAYKSRSVLLAGLPATALLLLSAVCSAAPGELATAPLFLSQQAKPNLLLAIDDSVSMDYELSMPSNDGALWWNTTDLSFVGRNEYNALESGRINVNQSGVADTTWKEYVYLFPNGFNSGYNGRRMLADGSSAYFALPPVDAYAFARSPDYNKSYYNPAYSYTPWPSYGNYGFADANPTAALYDPVYTSAGSLDLTTEFNSGSLHWGDPNWQFMFFSGMRNENNMMMGMGGLRPVAYFPATYYRPAGSTDNSGYTADPSCNTCKEYLFSQLPLINQLQFHHRLQCGDPELRQLVYLLPPPPPGDARRPGPNPGHTAGHPGGDLHHQQPYQRQHV